MKLNRIHHSKGKQASGRPGKNLPLPKLAQSHQELVPAQRYRALNTRTDFCDSDQDRLGCVCVSERWSRLRQ